MSLGAVLAGKGRKSHCRPCVRGSLVDTFDGRTPASEEGWCKDFGSKGGAVPTRARGWTTDTSRAPSASRARPASRRPDPGVPSDSGYSSCSSSSSSSEDCPKKKCATDLEVPLNGMRDRMYTFLRSFEDQYKYTVVSSLETAIAQVAGSSATFEGADYASLIQQLAALGVTVPASVATDLAAADTAASAALVKSLQGSINKVLSDLLAKVRMMCYSEIMTGLINNGLFASQVSNAFNTASPAITTAGNSLLAKQMAIFQRLGTLPPAALTLITTTLQTNRSNFIAFFTMQLDALQTAINADVTLMVTSLQALVTTSSTEFVQFANTEINALVNYVYGIPAPTHRRVPMGRLLVRRPPPGGPGFPAGL